MNGNVDISNSGLDTGLGSTPSRKNRVLGYDMNLSFMFFVIGVLLLVIILIITTVMTKNIWLLLMTVLTILLFLPNIILGLKSMSRLITMISTGNRQDLRSLADAIFVEHHTLKIVRENTDGDIDNKVCVNGIKSSQRVIYLAKYPDSIPEYMAPIYLDPVACIAKAPGGKKITGLLKSYYHPDYWIPFTESRDTGYHTIKEAIKNKIRTMSIFVYPERRLVQRKRGVVYEFHTGIFKIAKELNIPIVPVVIEYLPIQYIMRSRTQHIWLGAPINPESHTIDEMMAKTHDFMVKYTKS